MTDVERIAEQIHRILEGGDPSADSRWKQEEIVLYVAQAAAFFAKASYWENLRLDDRDIDGQYIVTVLNLQKQTETGTNRDYVDIGTQWVSLPRDRGLRYVRPMASTEPTIPLRQGEQFLLSTEGQLPLQGLLGYYVEGTKCYLVGQWGTPIMAGVVMPSIDFTNSLNVPNDVELLIIERVFGLLSNERQPDKVPDSNPAR